MVDGPDDERMPEPAAPFVPVLHDGIESDFVAVCLVRNFGKAAGEIDLGLPVWIRELAFADDARELYGWMNTKPERWEVWARLAPIVGPEFLTLMIDGEHDRDVRHRAGLSEQAEAVARAARTVEAAPTDIQGDPCVILRRGDEDQPFLVIAFQEVVERDRLWDWLRWQTHRYRSWRRLWEEKGSVALTHLIAASLLWDEQQAFAAGHAMKGRRPLRAWRGGGKYGVARSDETDE